MVDIAGGWGKPMAKKKESLKVEPTKTIPKEVESSKQQEIPSNPKFEPIPLIARAREGIYLIDDQLNNYQSDESKIICHEGSVSMFTKDGTALAFSNSKAIGLFIFAEKKAISYDLPGVIAMHFSKGEKYLVTIDKRDKDKHYITVFEVPTLKKAYEYETVKFKKEQWPQLKFVEDDSMAFRAPKPTLIEVLDPKKNFDVVKAIETKPFDYFATSVKLQNLLIVCVSLEHSAGYEKNEGLIEIYKFEDLTKPFATKTIDKAHEVNLFFSPTGQNLVIWAQTFTDKTGQSYYGEHVLFYLDMAKQALKRVPTYQGPIHDVAWNPNGKEFVAISGFMPGGSVLFDSNCVPKYEFGKHHRNTIRFSPDSKLLCLAGFGNLSGDIEIWDLSSFKKIGSFKSNSAVSCIWSPDSRRMLTGVLNPRLRVDNGYKIFKYNGDVLNTVDYSHTELYEVLWQPGKYQNRPLTPPKIKKDDEGDKKVFRPKGSGAFAAMLKAERGEATGGRFLNPEEIFGNDANLEQEETAEQGKKKKRNRKKKEKKQDEGDQYDEQY
jgi:translation initiation factor 2A